MTAHVPSSTSMPPARPPQALRCRAIVAADVEPVVDLLTKGFPERSKDYWARGLDRYKALGAKASDLPLGFVLVSGDRLVGVLLTLYAPPGAGQGAVRCNLSSWYVEPGYRPFATLLEQMAMKTKSTVFFNISAIPPTWPVHEARGFERYVRGQFVAVPLLSRPRAGVRVRAVTASSPMDDLGADERRLVADHVRFGCVCLIGTDALGSEPFVFVRRPARMIQRRVGLSGLSYFQLAYCRATPRLADFAHALGRHLLLRHAMPFFVVDAVEARPVLAGLYVAGRGVKFSRGPAAVTHGDLSYSEMVVFGP